MSALNISLFSSHIEALNLTLRDFQNLLNLESQQLKQNDPSALVNSSQTKNQLTDKIDALVATIQKDLPDDLQNQHFFELANQNAFADVSHELQTKLEESLALTQTCHDLNLANGMAIQILSNMNQVSLQILTGQSQTESKLYGSSGSPSKHKSQSSLGKA